MRAEGYNRKRIFARNLANLLVIVFIPLLTLSLLSVIITQRYIKGEVNKNNFILLEQASQKIDLIVSELDTFSLNFGVNPDMIVELDRIFNERALSYEDMKVFTILKSYIDSSSYVKPYVHSIYLYKKNVNKRLISSSNVGLTNLESYYDRDWYDTFQSHRGVQRIYSERRKIRQYSFEPEQPILTLYKNLFINNVNQADGVIVLNVKIDFLSDLLNSAVSYPEEGFVVTNENLSPLVDYRLPDAVGQRELQSFLADKRDYFTVSLSNGQYTVSKYHSPKYGWTYLSVTPNRSLYLVPGRLRMITLVLLILSLFLGVMLALYATRNNYISFLNILKMLDAAKEGRPLPSNIKRMKDEHSYIIQDVVKAFIKQDYFRMQLSERKYRMKVLELLALQSQINPHFLYNTLHTISWKSIALTQKPNEVSGMIDNLSTILKYSLSSSNDKVTLDEEIYYTMCYVNIQSVRYRNKFRVKWEYGDHLAEVRIMKLLLQPLIENSIYHGIKEKDGEGTIFIRIARDGEHLKIWVADDGLGMAPDRLREVRGSLESGREIVKSDHIGLHNVNKRLMLTYGDECRLKIKSAYGKGTAIYFKFPVAE